MTDIEKGNNKNGGSSQVSTAKKVKIVDQFDQANNKEKEEGGPKQTNNKRDKK